MPSRDDDATGRHTHLRDKFGAPVLLGLGIADRHLLDASDETSDFRVLHQFSQIAMSRRNQPHTALLASAGCFDLRCPTNLVNDHYFRRVILHALDHYVGLFVQ